MGCLICFHVSSYSETANSTHPKGLIQTNLSSSSCDDVLLTWHAWGHDVKSTWHVGRQICPPHQHFLAMCVSMLVSSHFSEPERLTWFDRPIDNRSEIESFWLYSFVIWSKIIIYIIIDMKIMTSFMFRHRIGYAIYTQRYAQYHWDDMSLISYYHMNDDQYLDIKTKSNQSLDTSQIQWVIISWL